MKEIQGKSILVRVRTRFELARVRVIESQQYVQTIYYPHLNTRPQGELTCSPVKEPVKVISRICTRRRLKRPDALKI